MKKCFKCDRLLERSEFYPHPRMGDGLLGKCKDCTKKDTADRHARKCNDLDWMISERARHREKSRKARLDGTAKKTSRGAMVIKNLKYQDKYPDKRLAHMELANAIRGGKLIRIPCEICGDPKSQGHHEDYNKPLEVVWLCRKHHAARHVQIEEQKLRERFAQYDKK